MSIPYPAEFRSNDPRNDDENALAFLNSRRVILLLKGPPSKPHCKFSKQITERLIKEGIRYYGFNVWECRDYENDRLYEKLKIKCPTYPQLWINGQFVSNLSGLDDFNLETNELGKIIHGILDDNWVSPVEELKPSDELRVRVRDPRDGRILSFATIALAREWAIRENMHLWYLRYPGYQDVVENEEDLPTDDIIPLVGEQKQVSIAGEQATITMKEKITRWIPLVTVCLAIGIGYWYQSRNNKQ